MHITTITAAHYSLEVIYDKTSDGLWNYYRNDNTIEDFIKNRCQQAFELAIYRKDNTSFVLNVASTEDFGMIDSWKQMPTLLERQLTIFLPIIQKFIVYALIGALDNI